MYLSDFEVSAALRISISDNSLRHFSVCRFSCTAIILLFIRLLVVFQRRVILWAEMVVNQCTTREFTAVPAVRGAAAAWSCAFFCGSWSLGVLESCWSLEARRDRLWLRCGCGSLWSWGCYYTMLAFFLGGLLTVVAVPLASFCLILEDISSGILRVPVLHLLTPALGPGPHWGDLLDSIAAPMNLNITGPQGSGPSSPGTTDCYSVDVATEVIWWDPW